jgi:hypothetical protein
MKIPIVESTDDNDRKSLILEAMTIVRNKATTTWSDSVFNDALQAVFYAFGNAGYIGGDATSGYGEAIYQSARALVNIKTGDCHVSVDIESL